MKNLLIFSLFMFGLTLVSCSDDDGPEVTITSPEDGETYAPGDVITISGSATDDVGVIDIDVTITNDDTPDFNQTLDLTGVTDKTQINFSLDLTLDVATLPGEYELTITAFDADGNSESDTVEYEVE